MKYTKLVKDGEDISILGYGCMRFPSKNGIINEKKTEEQIMYAIGEGVNYFDTAYPYYGGKSEAVLGKILAKHNVRDKVYIADKLPPYAVKCREDIPKIFNIQLKRLRTDYIDYYLIHSLFSVATWERLKEFGVLDYLKQWKEEGKIKHIGFSFHGEVREFKKIVDDYPWEFCQIQYNYLDENVQAGKEGLKYAAEKGLGVSVMEPLRGGNLAGKMPNKVRDKFESAKIKRSAAEWSLRWIWNHPEVNVILSGMNIDSHIRENIRIASEATPKSMSNEEISLIDEIKDIYKSLMKVPCTSCSYCMPCPFGVDIPFAFSMYNSKYLFDYKYANFQYRLFASGISGGKPSLSDQCRECGKCEKICPQNIEIIKELKNVTKAFDSKMLKIFFAIWRRLVIKD